MDLAECGCLVKEKELEISKIKEWRIYPYYSISCGLKKFEGIHRKLKRSDENIWTCKMWF